jgi:N-acetyl-gamma-glutamylphosphate reductase
MNTPKIGIIGESGAVGVTLKEKFEQHPYLKDLLSPSIQGVSQLCPR